MDFCKDIENKLFTCYFNIYREINHCDELDKQFD